MTPKRLGALLLTLVPLTLTAQGNPAAQAAREWRVQHERAIVDEFLGLLRLPNISRDRADIQQNADHIAGMLPTRGVETRLVSVENANPVVLGRIDTPGATRTMLFYAHYDGQPLDPKEWSSPPFTPTLRDRPVEDGGQVVPLRPPGSASTGNHGCTRARLATTRRRSWRS